MKKTYSMLENFKNIYRDVKTEAIIWNDYSFPGDERSRGVFVYFWLKHPDNFELWKYLILYEYDVDGEGISHPDDGIKYYVLFEYTHTYDYEYPIDRSNRTEQFSPNIIDQFGRYMHVFCELKIAKKAAAAAALNKIYPYLFLLSDKELIEWNRFVKEFE